jgi:spore germination protein GerM
VAATLAVLVLAVAGACGLRADDQPQPIPRQELDERLFRDGRGDTLPGTRWARIYVLSNETGTPRLVWVDERVPSTEAYEQAVIERLLQWVPPADEGGSRRYSTLIPSGTTLRDARRDGEGVLTVDLANLTIEGKGQAQALAQIVFTATDIAGIDYVRFAIDGKPVAVPLEQRSVSPGTRLSRRDFPSLDPERTQPTTTLPPVPSDPEPAPPATGTAATSTTSAAGALASGGSPTERGART